jgi:hypothetical protein
VIRLALATCPKERDLGSQKKVTTLAMGVAGEVRLQMEYEDWTAREREANRMAKRRGEQRKDLLAALKSRVKTVDARAWKRWARKIEATRDEPWPTEAKLQLGTMLIELMVKHGGGWFEVQNIPVTGGKTERRLILTDRALAAISDINQRQEVARPLLMPMIHPPKPWRWEPKEAA